MPEGNGIILKLADLDIEAKVCESDYVKILKGAFGNELGESRRALGWASCIEKAATQMGLCVRELRAATFP